ncbi:MAG: hypothetical protein LUD14_09020 [Clostridiales bacterium]|nr:hypothetical protein [Clostridiales bacterium]
MKYANIFPVSHEATFSQRLKALMEDTGIKNNTELSKEIFNKLEKHKKTGDYDVDKATMESIRKKIVSHTSTKRPSVPSAESVKDYCDFFHCDPSFLLGYIDFPTREAQNVYEMTGLSGKAISALQAFSQDSKNENGLFQAQYATSIEAIDFVLSYCYDARNHSNYARGLDIFHFIWSYLNADNVEMNTPERYRCGFSDINDGDKIVKKSGKEITIGKDGKLTVLKSDNTEFDESKITFHEKSNSKNCYNVEFAGLYKKHALGEIEKSLDKMKETLEKEGTDKK